MAVNILEEAADVVNGHPGALEVTKAIIALGSESEDGLEAFAEPIFAECKRLKLIGRALFVAYRVVCESNLGTLLAKMKEPGFAKEVEAKMREMGVAREPADDNQSSDAGIAEQLASGEISFAAGHTLM